MIKVYLFNLISSCQINNLYITMEIHSSVGKLSNFKPSSSGYQELDRQFTNYGFTYKSNEILHKTAQNHGRQYPYELLLHIAKTFHFNQFQIIFFTHILNDVEPCYNSQPELFNEDIEISQSVSRIIENIIVNQNRSKQYSNQMQQFNIILKPNLQDIKRQNQEEYNFQERQKNEFNVGELKKIYSYLLVLGYAVKYYLNQQLIIKPYDEEIKLRHPTFFASIFNRWAKKYGNTVLATTPRRINAYYLGIASQLEVQETLNNNNNEENCQYRNYNEIVEELIKATTQGEEYPEFQKQGCQE